MTSISQITDQQQQLRPGEIVDVTIYGCEAGYTHTGRTSFWYGEQVDGQPRLLFDVRMDDPAVSVTRAVPADGTPRPGDVWRDRLGVRYFAYRSRSLHGDVDLCSEAGFCDTWLSVHASLAGPITLEHRPPPTVEQVVAAALTPDAEVAS